MIGRCWSETVDDHVEHSQGSICGGGYLFAHEDNAMYHQKQVAQVDAGPDLPSGLSPSEQRFARPFHLGATCVDR